MKLRILVSLGIMVLLAVRAIAQDATKEEVAQPQPLPATNASAANAYDQWKNNVLLSFPLGLNAPHYAVALVVQRLDEQSVQLEYALAAQLNHYTLEVRPVKLLASSKGEVALSYLGKPLLIEPAGDRNLPARFRVGSETTVLYVGPEAEALEITWTPINGNDRLANSCIIPLRREPAVFVNGYVLGLPVR